MNDEDDIAIHNEVLKFMAPRLARNTTDSADASNAFSYSTTDPYNTELLQSVVSESILKSKQLEESQSFKKALVEQLINNGHSEELRAMSHLELLGYIVNALGGVVQP